MTKETAEAKMAQYKEWVIDAYAMPVDPDQLVEACTWRKDFEYWMRLHDVDTLDPESDDYAIAQDYVTRYLEGIMPSC